MSFDAQFQNAQMGQRNPPPPQPVPIPQNDPRPAHNTNNSAKVVEPAKDDKKKSKLSIILKAIYTTIMAFYALYGLIQAYRVYAKFRDLSKGYNNIVSNW